MKTNMQMLRELHIKYNKTEHIEGILTRDDMDLINRELSLKQRDILSLRNLRDTAVLYLMQEIDILVSAENRPGMRRLKDEISAITGAIDCRIYDLGGEV